jgi:hypothetical protein
MGKSGVDVAVAKGVEQHVGEVIVAHRWQWRLATAC